LFCSKEPHHHNNHQQQQQQYPLTKAALAQSLFEYQPNLNQLSDQFWSTVNPEKEVTWLQIQPPHLFIYDEDLVRVQDHVQHLQHLYHVKSNTVRYKPEYRTSLFRMFLLSIVQSTFVMLLSINIPILILCLVMIGIITWMTPKWRKQWLVPLLVHCFNNCILTLIQFFQVQYLKHMYYTYIVGQSIDQEKEYDGVHHRGAITVQNIFNQQQYRANVKTVQVRTLTHQHVADIQNLDANAKQSLVSCGQDGHLVLWHTDKENPTWMARLDKLYPSRGGVLQASLNTDFYNSSNLKKMRQKKPQKKKRAVSLSKHYLSKARCVKIDAANKWIAAAYDDGVIRVWNVNSGTLVREMDVHPHPVQVHQQEETHIRHRYHHASSPKIQTMNSVSSTDRILLLQFMGTITEFCHPLVAEAAARIKGSDNTSAAQNYIVSAHRSGVLHEWDILSGECINTVKTGHTNQITQLHVVDAKAPHRKFGVTWVFTASKDGTVKCWERHLLTKQDDDDNDHDDWSGPSVSTRWQLLYAIKQKSVVTSIATELPVGGMGVLVTGCSDGSVKVWNFETGESVCTLSLGKQALVPSSNQSVTSNASTASDSTDGIRKFSKFSTNSALLNDTSPFSSSSDDDDAADNASLKGHSRRTSVSDHRGAIYQVAVTRYCEVENGPGLCRSCDTCFGNGFLVASSAIDDKVHAWRLERSDNGLESTLCVKDYHRKQYKHRKTANSEDESHTSRRRRPSHGPVVIKKRHLKQQQPKEDDMLELLDIEQLAGDTHIPLKPTFLGKIDQPAGRGVVFCDKILAGVRQRRGRRGKQGRWETWFASLQYYDPSKSEQEEGRSNMRIPIETFDLEDDQLDSAAAQQPQQLEDQQKATQVLKDTLLGLFSSANTTATSQPIVKDQLKYKRIHAHTSDSSDEDVKKNKYQDAELDDDDDSLEAGENLPFSAVRHIIPLDGSGLACDFGNFIKLVFLDKPSLSEKEMMKQAQDTMESHQRQQRRQRQKMGDVVEEEQNDDDNDSGCQCNDDDDACSPANKGKDGCCGGANKEKNGGKCCGGNVKKKQKELRKQKMLLKPKAPANVTCGGIRSIAECSLKNNCSRAADCASSNQAIASSASVSSFSNWL
jgi:WD40 repeat protein/phage terminase Nu1 subunit (DNA packaging protein)